jgi:hypothetical protein
MARDPLAPLALDKRVSREAGTNDGGGVGGGGTR